MKIAIGADHRGFAYKQQIMQHFLDIEWIDIGSDSHERSDYPIFAHAVSKKVVTKEVQYGVLLCGTGIGMVIAANRHPGIYAGLAWNDQVARRAKEDDNINVLVLPADYISFEDACSMITAWIFATYRSGRYQVRLDLIDN